ncbi:hypothetical protein OQA88_12840 [Cercophora sp. LCS_1]
MGSLFLSDEELVKKDDDHKPTGAPVIRSPWTVAARVPPRKALKRLAVALVVGVLIYLFIVNIPTDVPIRDRRRPDYAGGSLPKHRSNGPPPLPKPKGGPLRAPNWSKPKVDKEKDRAKHKSEEKPLAPAASGYDGPIQFLKLAASLHAISETRGDYAENKNILFAASSLPSIGILLPMACQMGMELRSFVHFVVMSKSDISIEELKEINGIDDFCHVIFHDARPDYASSSDDARFQKAVMRAMYHINFYMHPQAVIVDSSDEEASLFLQAMRVQIDSMHIPLIELPEDSPSKLGWMSKLDSSSLASWHKLNIDILIHAAPGTSGNLIRLLKSLSTSDFSGSAIPHLTIELPNDVDAATHKFLETFQWPPPKAYNPTHTKQLTLRHRITRKSVTEEESSVRFLESFWPTDPRHSHVLLLSPQVDLSPWFFHYIKYTALEYLHSKAATTQQWDSRLFGISLDLPAHHLDGSKPLKPPFRKGSDPPDLDDPTSFLWQSPNSNAVLYTGQKWTELHGFVSQLLELQHQTPNLPPFFSDKLVSKRYPSWLEHSLKLSRARGYWTLYPSQMTAENLAVVHKELFRAPEEYAADVAREAKGWNEGILGAGSFLETLPERGKLLAFDNMPLLLWDGKVVGLKDVDATAEAYTNEMRRAVGRCNGMKEEELLPRKDAGDLFCLRL